MHATFQRNTHSCLFMRIYILRIYLLRILRLNFVKKIKNIVRINPRLRL